VNVRLRSGSFYDLHPFPYYIAVRGLQSKERLARSMTSNFDLSAKIIYFLLFVEKSPFRLSHAERIIESETDANGARDIFLTRSDRIARLFTLINF